MCVPCPAGRPGRGGKPRGTVSKSRQRERAPGPRDRGGPSCIARVPRCLPMRSCFPSLSEARSRPACRTCGQPGSTEPTAGVCQDPTGLAQPPTRRRRPQSGALGRQGVCWPRARCGVLETLPVKIGRRQLEGGGRAPHASLSKQKGLGFRRRDPFRGVGRGRRGRSSATPPRARLSSSPLPPPGITSSPFHNSEARAEPGVVLGAGEASTRVQDPPLTGHGDCRSPSLSSSWKVVPLDLPLTLMGSAWSRAHPGTQLGVRAGPGRWVGGFDRADLWHLR